MDAPDDLGSLLTKYTDRERMKANRLMTQIQKRFPAIPDWKDQDEKKRCVSAIENWLYRSIEKPNAEQWPLLVAMAAVLSLKRDEVEQLLRVAGMKTLGSLQQGASETYQDLFEAWMKPVFAEEVQGSLTGIGRDLQEQGGLIKEMHTHVLSVKKEASEDEKPVWMVPFTRNPFFMGREDLLQYLRTHLQTTRPAGVSQPQAISGLGGIGKTQIAMEYAYQFRQSYQWILWANAETDSTLITSYMDIAKLLDLPEKDEQEQEVIIQAVNNWLRIHQNWLFILDNADEPDLLSPFLPPFANGHMLLTTRATNLGGLGLGIAHPVKVEAFSPQQGACFLLRRAGLLALDDTLDLAEVHNQNMALQITDKLGGLPLALDQAGAYIAATQISLDTYLQIYDQHHIRLLKERLNREYPESVVTTWTISFERIEAKNPAAAELLRLCAHLAPDAIPEAILTQGAEHLGQLLGSTATDPLSLNKAIETLRDYSLLSRNAQAQTLVLHRLVQMVVRNALSVEERNLWMQRVIQAVNATFPPIDFSTWSRCEYWLPHALFCSIWIEQEQITTLEAASLLDHAGRYLGERARYAQAVPLLERALALRRLLLEAKHADIAASLNNLAALYLKQEKHGQAESLLKQALAIWEQQSEIDASGTSLSLTSLALHNLAALYYVQEKYEQAEPLLERALAIIQLSKSSLNLASSLNTLAEVYRAQRKYEQAEQLLVQALIIRKLLLGQEHPDTADSLHNLGGLYWEQQKYDQAEPCLKQALSIRLQLLGEQHPDIIHSSFMLGVIYRKQKRYEQAEPLLKQALSIQQQLFGEQHPRTMTCFYELAILYIKWERYADAESLLEQKLSILEKQLGAEPTVTVIVIIELLVIVYYHFKKYGQAEPLLRQVLLSSEQLLGADDVKTVIRLQNLVEHYSHQKDYEQAKAWLRRAWVIYDQQLEQKHPNLLGDRERYTRLLKVTEKKHKSSFPRKAWNLLKQQFLRKS